MPPLSRVCLSLLAGLWLSTAPRVAHAATWNWPGTEPPVQITSIPVRKTLFLSLNEVDQKLPVSVMRDTTAGLFVLCGVRDCVPVYAADESEIVKRETETLVADPEGRLGALPAQVPTRVLEPYVRVDLVAQALGCKAEVRNKNEIQVSCDRGVPAQRPGDSEGKPAPGFRLNTLSGTPLDLADLLAQGPVAVAFVRSGDWDPLSRGLLRGLQDRLDSLHTAGVQVVAIHGYEATMATRWADSLDLTFPLLSDERSAVMRGYGVFERGSLPLPALFLIDPQGIIRLREVFEPGVLVPEFTQLMQAIQQR